METALTIFAIVTGTASFLSFLYPFFRQPQKTYRRWCKFGMGAAVLWSFYVLFFPGSVAEKNVHGKLMFFRNPAIEREGTMVLIQRGEFSFGGFGPFAVEFHLPFRSAPEIEIVNSGGYDEDKVPRVEKVSPHQFIVKRASVGGAIIPESLQKYRWIARGTPLEEVPSQGK